MRRPSREERVKQPLLEPLGPPRRIGDAVELAAVQDDCFVLGRWAELAGTEVLALVLQVLESLIQQEVMFQKAEKEGTVPSDEEITAEINKQKTQSGKSADQIEKDMKDAGMTEAAIRDQVKKQIAIQKLVDKITNKIGAPSESEVAAFYNGNKEAFVKKKGVKLGAIIIDPANSGEGDQTVDDQSAQLKMNEISTKLYQQAQAPGVGGPEQGGAGPEPSHEGEHQGTPGDGKKKGGDGEIDADYEVVK